MADNSWLSVVQMVNVSSIFAGMLRAGLPALAQHLITLMDQPEENPMVRFAQHCKYQAADVLPCTTHHMLKSLLD